jgi:hypothetical protein
MADNIEKAAEERGSGSTAAEAGGADAGTRERAGSFSPPSRSGFDGEFDGFCGDAASS